MSRYLNCVFCKEDEEEEEERKEEEEMIRGRRVLPLDHGFGQRR